MDRGEETFTATWLCPTPRDRARMLDMEQRLAPVRHVCFAAIAAGLIASGTWVGWWTLAPLALALVGFIVLGRNLEELARPEYRIAALVSQAIIAVSIALTGGPASPALAWLAIPTVTLPARFGPRGVVAGGTLTIVVLLAVTLGMPARSSISVPTIMTLTLIVSVMALSVALMRSDLDHRSEAAIDRRPGCSTAAHSRRASSSSRPRPAARPSRSRCWSSRMRWRKIFERFYTDRPHQGFGQILDSGCRSRNRSSRRMADASGENCAGPLNADGEATVAGARFVVSGRPHHDGCVACERPRFRGAGRKSCRADPRLSGAGKSHLAFDLILAGRAGQIAPGGADRR